MDVQSGPRRRKKSASERRAQKLRSDARALQRVLQGLCSIKEHRGSQLTRVGGILREAIQISMASPQAEELPMPVFAQRRAAASGATVDDSTLSKRKRCGSDEGHRGSSGNGASGGAFTSACDGGAQQGSEDQTSDTGRRAIGRGKGLKFRLPPRHVLEQFTSIVQQATSAEEEEWLHTEWEQYLKRLQVAPRGGKGCPLPPFIRQDE